MNIDMVDPANPMLFASFNQDYSRLVIGTRLGFKLFNTEPDFVPIYKDESGGCGLVEVLYNTKLVAVVGSGEHPSSSARRVSLINCGHGKEIYSLSFPTPVLAVRMSKNRLIVVTESIIYLYELQTNRLLTTIDTPPNPHGVVALTNRDPENGQTQSLLAFPGHTAQGDLVLYDTNALKIARVVKNIHKTPLRFIQFSPDDRVIATASETVSKFNSRPWSMLINSQGTVIKVRAVDPRLDKELSFRRGTLHGATIASIAFNSDGTLLAVSSSNGTVHLFKVPSLYDLELNQSYVSHQPSPVGTDPQLSGAQSSMLGYFVGNYFSADATRSFATIRTGSISLCGFSRDSSRLYIVTPDGKFSKYQIELNCKLERQELLLSDMEEEDFEGPIRASPPSKNEVLVD